MCTGEEVKFKNKEMMEANFSKLSEGACHVRLANTFVLICRKVKAKALAFVLLTFF